MTKTPKRPAAGLPDPDTLIAFLREAGEAEKADIARAFGLKGAERRQLLQRLFRKTTLAVPLRGMRCQLLLRKIAQGIAGHLVLFGQDHWSDKYASFIQVAGSRLAPG